MLKHKTFKYRIYPNKEQQVLISKTIGCSRLVFNYLLNVWQVLYETTGSGLSYHKCSAILTGIAPESPYRACLASAVGRMALAWQNILQFESHTDTMCL